MLRTWWTNSWAKSKPRHATCWIFSTATSLGTSPNAPPRCVASASSAGPASRRTVSPSVGGRHPPIRPIFSTFIRAIDPKSNGPSTKPCATLAIIGSSTCPTASLMPVARGAHHAAIKWRRRAPAESCKMQHYSTRWGRSRIRSISSTLKRHAFPCRTWRI